MAGRAVGRSSGSRSCSRRTSRACSRPATCAPAPTVAWRQPWVRVRRRSIPSTVTCGRSDGMGATLDPGVMSLLAQHRALGNAPVAEHEWLAAHGTLRSYGVGDVVLPKGEAAPTLMILFSGHLVIRVDRSAASRKIF